MVEKKLDLGRLSFILGELKEQLQKSSNPLRDSDGEINELNAARRFIEFYRNNHHSPIPPGEYIRTAHPYFQRYSEENNFSDEERIQVWKAFLEK